MVRSIIPILSRFPFLRYFNIVFRDRYQTNAIMDKTFLIEVSAISRGNGLAETDKHAQIDQIY